MLRVVIDHVRPVVVPDHALQEVIEVAVIDPDTGMVDVRRVDVDQVISRVRVERVTADGPAGPPRVDDGVSRQMLAVLTWGERVELLKTIRVPTLVIHGVDDPLTRVEAAMDTARRIPGAELRLIPGMGHDVAPGLIPILVEAIAEHTAAAER